MAKSHFSLISLIIEEPKEIGQELRHPLFNNGQESHFSLISLTIEETKKNWPGELRHPLFKNGRVTLVSYH